MCVDLATHFFGGRDVEEQFSDGRGELLASCWLLFSFCPRVFCVRFAFSGGKQKMSRLLGVCNERVRADEKRERRVTFD